jgi:FkbM family methyltransferase
MALHFFYGIKSNMIDVTEKCIKNCVKKNIVYIPSGDHSRAKIFSDPIYGVLKSFYVLDVKGDLNEYNDSKNVYIDLNTNVVYINNDIPDYIKEIYPNYPEKLFDIRKNLKLDFGSFNDEYPEQLMSIRYLTGKEKVLEIGGNIGRNSLVISTILNKNNNNQFVSLESDSNIANQLIHNRDINNLQFFVESSALSKRKLIQRGWDTIASDVVLNGYKEVNIISWNELKAKYNIDFDTLVLDCEGAFYYILMDMPEILTNIKLIMMENDYHEYSKKQFVDDILIANGFVCDYTESGGWGPCQHKFFETWKKI